MYPIALDASLKPIRRTKRATLEALKRRIGHLRLDQITRERLIEFGKSRAKDGVSPSTLGGLPHIYVPKSDAVSGIGARMPRA